jgi:hypothetical protein
MANLSYLSPQTEVRESPIHGKGLFAIAPIPKDEIVCVKGGYIFNRQTLNGVAPSLGPVITGQDWRKLELQEKYRGYISWYLVEKMRRAAANET